MEIFECLEKYDYEQLVYAYDQYTGLKAIIAIHDTTLGPALGGTRMWPYISEEEALDDVLRLSRGMTYKAAAAGLNLGGGKAVIIGHPQKDKNEKLFRSYARYIDSLGGRYITAEDVGTCQSDMNIIKQETRHVVGVTRDPSTFTAFGVLQGIKAAVKEVYGRDSLEGLTVAIQGLGNVGFKLCDYLNKEGAALVVTDINQAAIKKAVAEFGAKAVEPHKIYGVNCNIFAPCALGAVVSDITIPSLKCEIIAGAANNVLESNHNGDFIQQLGILYVPDYIINAGGVINVEEELIGNNEKQTLQKVAKIYDTTRKVINLAKTQGIPTYRAADLLATKRIQQAKQGQGGDVVG
ncbi:leucine dehydrogenase [Metallumcola ferriviriculae]|uniref:Leucine dehydrogenase n=1 Tax=Metallumcola ferriviriculae TaxID=3039180 RepID=A0AAU0UME1_9FIRM|nr:leucine dehydrogenase [Desulfitibacteraceae bacterium MK1]